ncbi:MAG: MlaE family lipid ABC transporter permease subunit [Phycisphaeraceae bacterium]|nr:MlaE family lipid ABC transporter permease subunit [Phycisphaeraceae bacterium]
MTSRPNQPGVPPSASATSSVENGSATLTLRGRLDTNTLGGVWDDAVRPLRDAGARSLAVDVSGVEYCDGAGLALLVELDRLARVAGGTVEFRGISDDLRGLFDRARSSGEPRATPAREGFVTQVGRATGALIADFRVLTTFLGELTAALAWAAMHPTKIRYREMFLICEKAGARATPVVCLLGFLMGLIISFQSAAPLRALGVESTIPMLLAIAMVRELGPLVTAIILAGRSGSAFAAELGTMKVTEEINALTTMGIEPARFLVVPRLLAAMLMTPLLSLFATLCGLVGGYVIMLTLGFSFPFYVREVQGAVDGVDLMGGLAKSVVFAFLVAAVGCARGLQTRGGPGAVGNSTTNAVVTGIVLIVAANAVLGVMFYFLGI